MAKGKIRKKKKKCHFGKRAVAQRLRRLKELTIRQELALAAEKEKLESTCSSRVKEGLIPPPSKRGRDEEDPTTSTDVPATSTDVPVTSMEVTIKVEPIFNDEEATADVEQPAAINLREIPFKEKPSKFTPGPYRMKGRRIVDVGYFIPELLNLSVHNESGRCSLSDMSTVMECTKGIVSGFVFKCRVCRFRKVIWTEDPENDNDDMNADAILSTMDLANDLPSMNQYFSKMKLPKFNRHFFKWKYKRLTKETVASAEEDPGDEEEWCGEEDMPSEGENRDVLIDDSIVIKQEPEEGFSDTEVEDLRDRTQMCEIASSGIGLAVETDENIIAGCGSSSAIAERDKEGIETVTIGAGSIKTCSKINPQVKVSGNTYTDVNVQPETSVSVIENNIHEPKEDSTIGSCKKGTKRPYVEECITLPESNLSKRVYAYPVEFLISLSKFVWSSLFICVNCLEDFSTHELIKAHCCKTYSKSILGIPPLTNFQKMLPSENTKSCFETLKSTMAEKKSTLDLAVSASKEVQRMMNIHAQSRKATEEKIKNYERAVAYAKASPQRSKDSEDSPTVASAFSEIQTSLASESKAEKLLTEAKRNQINVLEAAAEATERECVALVDFVQSLRGDKVGNPQEILEKQQEPPSNHQEISRTSCSPKKNLQ